MDVLVSAVAGRIEEFTSSHDCTRSFAFGRSDTRAFRYAPCIESPRRSYLSDSM